MTELMESLKSDIEEIQLRNKGVTADKAWEISFIRRALIAVYTYLAVWGFLTVIEVESAALNALVPPSAFLISTLTMPYAKNIWLKHYFKCADKQL